MGIVAAFEEELFRKAPARFARWHAIDLHNHSPSSPDYRGDKATAVEASAEQIRKSELSIVMFTDHEKLPDPAFTIALARATGKTILRGMELNVFVDAWGKPEGKVDKNLFFHLLVGFDPDGKLQPEYWMQHVYAKCSETRRMCGNQEIRGVSASIDDIASLLKEAGAIIIPAHLHSTHDAFRSRSVDDIYNDKEFLRCARNHFTALEVTDLKTANFFDGQHPETGNLVKTCIRSSDAHEPALLGTRVSWAQMETPSFGELKAALELPFRISLDQPQEPASHILGIHVHGQFFPDLWMTFSPHCNAFIGVKGSGKTSLLEALRFSLGAPVPESHKDAVANHLQNILGTNGSVRVLIKRADGAKLLVERSLRSRAFKVTFANDRVEEFPGPEGLLFPCYILGWHEIEQVATDANIRHVYLETIAGRDQMRSLQGEASVTSKQIRQLHEVASLKYTTFRSSHDQVGRLENLRRGLQELTDDNLIALRDRYEVAIRHRDAVGELRRALQKALEQTGDRAKSLGVSMDVAVFDGESPVGTHAQEARDLVLQLGGNVGELAVQHETRLRELIGHADRLASGVEADFATFYADYEARVSTLPPEKKRLLESHQRVMEETKELPRLRGDLVALKSEVGTVLRELSELCERVARCLDERTRIREEKVAELNRVLAVFGVQLAVEALTVHTQRDSLAQRYSAGAKIYTDLGASVATQERRYHRRLAQAYEGLRNNLIDGFRLFFESAEFGYFVDCFEEDDLKIRFKVGKTGEEFSPIDQLSAGQRCTAIFPLLLKMEHGPLIVDQPEDNLDNRHIADSIAPALVDDKRTRQVAFTSHNANLVVLTDAEHIVSFEASGSEGRAEARGFLCASHSPVTKHVVAILDGGERALELRYRKYGRLRPASQ